SPSFDLLPAIQVHISTIGRSNRSSTLRAELGCLATSAQRSRAAIRAALRAGIGSPSRDQRAGLCAARWDVWVFDTEHRPRTLDAQTTKEARVSRCREDSYHLRHLGLEDSR